MTGLIAPLVFAVAFGVVLFVLGNTLAPALPRILALFRGRPSAMPFAAFAPRHRRAYPVGSSFGTMERVGLGRDLRMRA